MGLATKRDNAECEDDAGDDGDDDDGDGDEEEKIDDNACRAMEDDAGTTIIDNGNGGLHPIHMHMMLD